MNKHIEKIVKESPGFDNIAKLSLALDKETDRGCALMVASYLDSQIEVLLRIYFVDNEEVKSDMLGPSKPIGSFSSRIDLLYLLGIIGPNARKDLHIIRKIRNDFGHSPEAIDFNNQSISDRCKNLHGDAYGKDSVSRDIFVRVVMGLLGLIESRIRFMSPIKEKTEPSIEDLRDTVDGFLKALPDVSHS